MFLIPACKKVETEQLQPDEVEHCSVPIPYQGTWWSDSVWVQTYTDSIDSVYFEDFPGIFYTLDVTCNENEKQLLLEYIGYNFITTKVISSTNFLFADSAYLAFDAFDSTRIHNDASLHLKVLSKTDSLMLLEYHRQNNPGQETTYRMFMNLVGQQ